MIPVWTYHAMRCNTCWANNIPANTATTRPINASNTNKISATSPPVNYESYSLYGSSETAIVCSYKCEPADNALQSEHAAPHSAQHGPQSQIGATLASQHKNACRQGHGVKSVVVNRYVSQHVLDAPSQHRPPDRSCNINMRPAIESNKAKPAK